MNNSADNCPSIIGVGQVTEPVPTDLNKISSNADLAALASNAAMADAKNLSLAAHIDTIAFNRIFADSMPNYIAPFGGPTNLPRALAKRIDANPQRAVYPKVGGNTPQELVNTFAETLANGESKLVLLAGAEVSKNIRAALKQGVSLDWSETPKAKDKAMEDAGLDLSEIISPLEVQHNIDMPILYYALLENARRASRGQSREAYMHDMANKFSQFSHIAAANSHANDKTIYDPEFITTASVDNPLICTPYTKALVAKESVNQAAAILMTTVGYAKELGIDKSLWVYLHGYCDVKDRLLLERSNLAHSTALEQVLLGALANADKHSDAIKHFDLYSCFPIVVSQASDVLNLATDDPRSLTQTGGLPFFGGPGNNYSMHGIAALTQTLRQDPKSFGLVLANGGFLSKFSAGVYSTTPIETWSASDSQTYQNRVNSEPKTEVENTPNGEALIETYTVLYQRGSPIRAIIIGHLKENSKRFYASLASEDSDTIRRLIDVDSIGQSIWVESFTNSNRITFFEN